MSRNAFVLLLTAGLVLFANASMGQQPQPKQKILKPCSQCHAPDQKLLRGTLGNVSERAETFAINSGSIWNIKFDENTEIMGWQGPLNKMPKDKEIAVTFIERDGEPYAKTISVKQPAKVPAEKLLNVDQVSEIVEKGNAVIIDSRPAPRFYEGAIPGAINVYDADFDKHSDKLPKDKDKLIVFYCAGPT